MLNIDSKEGRIDSTWKARNLIFITEGFGINYEQNLGYIEQESCEVNKRIGHGVRRKCHWMREISMQSL